METKRKRIFFRTVKWSIAILLVISIFSIVLANNAIKGNAKGRLFDNVGKTPYNKVGLLLGTSKHLSDGRNNLYYVSRISATFELYKNHKIDYLVISGDNGLKGYNEPEDMKNDLVQLGMPDSIIYLDYAGFRTYDSVIRMNKIFGQNNFTVISQQFHNERAIYIANHFGLNVIGFNAKDVNKYFGVKTKIREQFARVKVFIDILTSKKPKFLGSRINIK